MFRCFEQCFILTCPPDDKKKKSNEQELSNKYDRIVIDLIYLYPLTAFDCLNYLTVRPKVDNLVLLKHFI